MEDDEDAASAICREAREEIGLHLDRRALSLASTVHFRNEHGEGRLGLFFHAQSWEGEPVNAEPHKCARLG
ncbi:NUDIX domain-containing protein, partial [Frankia sp. Cj3]